MLLGVNQASITKFLIHPGDSILALYAISCKIAEESVHDINLEEEQAQWERLDLWAQLCDHLIKHENEDFILNFDKKSRLNL